MGVNTSRKWRKYWIYGLNPARPEGFWWRGLDLNQRRLSPTDLQSVPFSHSGTPPMQLNQ
jgi:hypothetical protein